jgi:hypothetical protein
MSPEASDFAWIFVVKPPRERPSARSSCPLLLRPPTRERARCRVEHLNEMRCGAHRRERVEEGLEDAGLAQAIEAFPHAVPRTEALRQRAPANVLDGEEMKRLEKAAIILSLASPPRQAGAEHRKRMRQSSSSIFVDIGSGPVIRSESYESCPIPQGNRKNVIGRNFVHMA